MTSLNVVPTSRPRHRRPPDIGALVADLRRQHGKQANNALFQLLLEDEAVARALADFVCEKLVAAPRRRRVMPSAKERAEHRAQDAVQVEKLVSRVKAAVLDMEIGGKKLRFHTGAEVAHLGAGFVKLAERVPSDCLVGEILTEHEAAALMRSAV
jgi:hypothetical protein